MKIKKTIICVILLLAMSVPAGAQRMMENLSRGLVAVKTTGGVYLSWRLLGQEWYDVTYNVYRDGVRVNSEPLVTSNYQDAAGEESSIYTVRAVVRGVEQEDSETVTPWTGQYLDIPMQPILDASGVDITDN